MTRIHPLLSILAGAAVLLWPVWLNGYPILFSDTVAFLAQGGEGLAIWDKPFIYGPALAAAHVGISLFIPAALQALIVSHLLWLWLPRHLPGCILLAAGSTLPWFTGFLMPDIFAPVVVLASAWLAFQAPGRMMRLYLIALCAFAIASHLAHLPIAAAMVAMTFLLARRRTLLVATPLALAVAALLATNVLLFQKFTLSPHGAVFAVARFSGDGLVENILAKNCPQSGWHLCDWQGRLPTDSDEFLWNPKGPVESYPHAPIAPMAMAPEAQKILAATIRQEPFGVLSAMAGNTLTQLHRVALGDVLTAAAAGQSMDATIRKFLGPAEQSRYDASRQAQDRLLWIAERLNRISLPVQILGVLATLWTIWRGPRLARNMALLILAGLLANAFATGALSGPHDRYQARIAWLILLPLLMRPERVLPESAAG